MVKMRWASLGPMQQTHFTWYTSIEGFLVQWWNSAWLKLTRLPDRWERVMPLYRQRLHGHALSTLLWCWVLKCDIAWVHEIEAGSASGSWIGWRQNECATWCGLGRGWGSVCGRLIVHVRIWCDRGALNHVAASPMDGATPWRGFGNAADRHPHVHSAWGY